MKKHETAMSATYTPQTFKSFEGALFSFMQKECPQIGGEQTRQVLVKCVTDMVHKFFPATNHLAQGQIVWPTVHIDAKGSYGKRIQDTELTPVILDLVQAQDAADRANGKRLRDLKQEAVARLCIQAHQQKGCLTNAELSILLKTSPATIGKYIADWESKKQTVLPRRGSMHDMGPTLTHKKIIIHKLFIEQKTVQQTARETLHSLPAIQRYISAFRQTLLCRQKGMKTGEIAFAIHKTTRLVKEYEKIIDDYAEKSYVLDRILSFQPNIENNAVVPANEFKKGTCSANGNHEEVSLHA
jgi:hypothetical protein